MESVKLDLCMGKGGGGGGRGLDLVIVVCHCRQDCRDVTEGPQSTEGTNCVPCKGDGERGPEATGASETGI